MSRRLDGLFALVTGSTSGIGRACARQLAAAGAHVIVTGRDHDRGGTVVKTIRDEGGIADFISGDLSTLEGPADLADAVLALTGRVDVLVNNAGVFTFGSTLDTDPFSFDRIYDLNVRAPYFLTQALIGPMTQRGRGRVINVLTGAALRGSPASGLYGSSKAAMLLLTKAWAAEFGPSGVRVNAVSPGPVRTEGTADGAGLEQVAQMLPARRLGLPSEVAAAVGFLASEDSSYVHGAILPVDGGAVAA